MSRGSDFKLRHYRLGTLGVRAYLDGNHGLELEPAGFDEVKITTHGPDGRFGSLMFVEKEGFGSLFKKVKLGERFDITTSHS